MSEILVTFSSLHQAQTDVVSTAASLNHQLADLKSFLAPMVSTWSGAAAQNYQAKQRVWDSAAQDLNDVLARIGQALGAATEDFQRAEASNANVWR